jgi:hypothetical protein
MNRQNEQRILITQAMPGMALARAVTLPNKITLCKPGQILSDELIFKLMNRGIKRIFVQGHPLPAHSQDNYEERIKQLRKRFSRVRTQAIMLSLERVVEREIVRRV